MNNNNKIAVQTGLTYLNESKGTNFTINDKGLDSIDVDKLVNMISMVDDSCLKNDFSSYNIVEFNKYIHLNYLKAISKGLKIELEEIGADRLKVSLNSAGKDIVIIESDLKWDYTKQNITYHLDDTDVTVPFNIAKLDLESSNTKIEDSFNILENTDLYVLLEDVYVTYSDDELDISKCSKDGKDIIDMTNLGDYDLLLSKKLDLELLSIQCKKAVNKMNRKNASEYAI